MKIHKSLLVVTLMTAFLACKSHKETAREDREHEEDDVVAPMPAEPTNARVTVSFISIGEGTDFRAKDSLMKFLSDYEQSSGKAVKYESVPWGREGEMDFCFPLTELKANDQKQFVEALTARMKFSELVQIVENQPCRQRR